MLSGGVYPARRRGASSSTESPRVLCQARAWPRGTAGVSQDLSGAEPRQGTLTTVENMFLGRLWCRASGARFDCRKGACPRRWLESYHEEHRLRDGHFPVAARSRSCRVAEKQMVEIARALIAELVARSSIMDEPTSATLDHRGDPQSSSTSSGILARRRASPSSTSPTGWRRSLSHLRTG